MVLDCRHLMLINTGILTSFLQEVPNRCSQNIKMILNFILLSQLVYSQIRLNIFVDNCQYGYITEPGWGGGMTLVMGSEYPTPLPPQKNSNTHKTKQNKKKQIIVVLHKVLLRVL